MDKYYVTVEGTKNGWDNRIQEALERLDMGYIKTPNFFSSLTKQGEPDFTIDIIEKKGGCVIIVDLNILALLCDALIECGIENGEGEFIYRSINKGWFLYN